MEQQEFVERFARIAHDKAEKIGNGDLFYQEFGVGLLRYLMMEDLQGQRVAQELVRELVAEARMFARVPSEMDYLVCLMFKKMEGSMFSAVRYKYEEDRFRDPQRTLGAPHSMIEVKLK